MSLVASQVSYTYAVGTPLAHQAIEDLSLTVEPGKSLLVIGATGSGKSTLLRQMAGLLSPSSGSVLLDGVPVRPGTVGFVFQQPEAQLFSETVEKDVMFGPLNLGASEDEARERAQAALRAVGLSPDGFSERSPFSLSGGQARRVAIAGVLAMGAPYLLFDEPTAGLDGIGRRFIHDLMGAQREQGRGIVVVSHDVEEFLGRVDDALLLREGRMVWKGPASDLIASPHLFGRAGLAIPDLLWFQKELACPDGSYSFDVDKVAHWALEGYPPGGPLGHTHGDACDDTAVLQGGEAL